MSHRKIERDYQEVRRAKYEQRDHELFHALAGMAEKLVAGGVDVGELMKGELRERNLIKTQVPKPETTTETE